MAESANDLSKGHSRPQVRKAVAQVEVYEGGRTTEMVRQELNLKGKVVKLASNENPFPTLPSVLQAITTSAAQSSLYPDFSATDVRETLAEYLGKVESTQIVIGCGSANLMQQVFLTYIEPGDEVIFPWPGFRAHPLYTKMCGGTPVTVPLIDHTIDLDSLLRLITKRTRLICVTNPNNPTSTAVKGGDLRSFLDQVPENILVLIDEAYIEYAGDSDIGNGVVEAQHHPNVLALRTFSKAFGLAGLRIGFAVGPTDIVTNVRRTGFPFAVNTLAQAAALAALKDIDEVLNRVRYVMQERERLTTALREDGWNVAKSESNFLWLPMGSQSSSLLAKQLETKNVITRPFEDGLRITVGLEEENNLFRFALGVRQLNNVPPLIERQADGR